MDNKIKGHLDEELIIEALVDESALDSAGRRHLLECSACRAERDLLELRLARFGQLSREHSPAPSRQPRLPRAKAATSRHSWRVRPSFGMGLVFACLIALLFSPYLFKHDSGTNLDKVYQEMIRDEKFMTEVEKLEEEPLPKFYVDITNFADPDSTDDSEDSKLPGQDEKTT